MNFHFAMRLAQLCMLLICGSATSTSLANNSQTLFTSTYEGEFSGWDVKMHRSLRQTGPNEYVFASEAKNLFASIRETSSFRVDQQITPLHYEYYRKVFGRRVRETLEFDWPKLTASYHRSDRDEGKTVYGVKAPLFDPSLYQLFLQRDAYLGKEKLDYSFAKRKGVRTYSFEKTGTDMFHYRGQPLKAEVYRKLSDDGDQTTVWLIPALNHQIGMLTHKDEDGSTYQVRLTDYSADEAALKDFYKQTP